MPVDRSAIAALVAEVRRVHYEYGPDAYCLECGLGWPCDAIKLCDAVDALLAEGAEVIVATDEMAIAAGMAACDEMSRRSGCLVSWDGSRQTIEVWKIALKAALAAARPPASPASPAAER